ncbi:unnamed protein product [Polarella glacialis]|uniref:Uncharacterized protein n=1 Tax=Polarella glacialis TaxID=89957 RepID=A0A813I469_POLGL|nr:unnamed protein product [Polarella glacialis]
MLHLGNCGKRSCSSPKPNLWFQLHHRGMLPVPLVTRGGPGLFLSCFQSWVTASWRAGMASSWLRHWRNSSSPARTKPRTLSG